MKQTKKILAVGILIMIFLVSAVNAEFWACFNKGEKAEFCGGYMSDKTCSSSFGCSWCMSEYREAEGCYIHGSWAVCSGITQNCEYANGVIDSEPPEFNLLSPNNEELFTSRKVLLEFSLDEEADVYYLDLINGRGRWTRVCSDCNPGDPAYSKERSFKEGVNELMFKARDGVGNEAFQNVSFFVDSKKPKIMKTSPKSGFATGNFEVEFKEENPKNLILHYSSQQVQLNLGSDCHLDRTKYYCSKDVNLGSFDGEEIEYWFTLEDIAGNIDESKHYTLDVDTTLPEIKNPNSFWEVDGNYVYFSLELEEENFDEASYNYYDSRGKLRERRLCSRLKDGVCEKRVRFSEGYNEITVNIKDKANNLVGIGIGFNI